MNLLAHSHALVHLVLVQWTWDEAVLQTEGVWQGEDVAEYVVAEAAAAAVAETSAVGVGRAEMAEETIEQAAPEMVFQAAWMVGDGVDVDVEERKAETIVPRREGQETTGAGVVEAFAS